MKVVRRKSSYKLKFGDLDVGKVFAIIHIRDPHTAYMKTNKNLSENAISLEYCAICSIGTHEEVVIIDGAFIEDGAESPSKTI